MVVSQEEYNVTLNKNFKLTNKITPNNAPCFYDSTFDLKYQLRFYLYNCQKT